MHSLLAENVCFAPCQSSKVFFALIKRVAPTVLHNLFSHAPGPHQCNTLTTRIGHPLSVYKTPLEMDGALNELG